MFWYINIIRFHTHAWHWVYFLSFGCFVLFYSIGAHLANLKYTIYIYIVRYLSVFFAVVHRFNQIWLHYTCAATFSTFATTILICSIIWILYLQHRTLSSENWINKLVLAYWNWYYILISVKLQIQTNMLTEEHRKK